MKSRNCDGTDWVRLGEIHAMLAVVVDPAERVCQSCVPDFSVCACNASAGGAEVVDVLLALLELRFAPTLSADDDR